jgi:hypothetical protein
LKRRGASKESLFRALCLDRIYRRETHTLRDHRHALLAEEGFVVYLEIPRDDEQEEPYVLSRRNDENEDANRREIPNESTRLFSVESDLKLAKMTRAQGSWSPLRAFLSILSIAVVAMICIYVGYAEDVYDSEKVLSTEAKEAAEALYTREKFLFFGKEDGRLGNRNFQRWELPKKLW